MADDNYKDIDELTNKINLDSSGKKTGKAEQKEKKHSSGNKGESKEAGSENITIKLPSLPSLHKLNLSLIKKNPWIAATFVLAVIAIFLLFRSGSGVSGTLSTTEANTLVSSFLSNQLLKGSAVQILSVTKDSGLYNINTSVDGKTVSIYFTLDGKFIQQGVPLISIKPADLNVTASGNTSDPNARVDVSVDNDAVEGSANAKVTIIEFSDFQCPYCRKFYSETYSQLKTNYIGTGKAKLVFRDFPLSNIHPMAEKSAEATECVREKGGDTAYFKMHDKIFEEQNLLDSGSKTGAVSKTVTYTDADLKKWAKDLGYDISSCLDSGKYASEVAKDLSDGSAAGVTGTPAFFINGRLIPGALPFTAFQQAIDQELAGQQ